jgi:hypothetical protein
MNNVLIYEWPFVDGQHDSKFNSTRHCCLSAVAFEDTDSYVFVCDEKKIDPLTTRSGEFLALDWLHCVEYDWSSASETAEFVSQGI